ncbi:MULTISPECIES: phosphodiesterase [Mesorhizobium]|uniref:Phosphodiesterase n=1 Tax=Mesorhizobium abyssinicae TaxID=1209958 RepID=A0ABU5ALA5_9HYPH|nr:MULTISPECIES: phosphodiesterase [Mesorhizobium]MDX8538007.1 phosphodiesterase [Mesorhizobium abyssinicae]RUW21407.1 phosphodiesterase [Mesorhizobium sp. M4B.F.Ca.ET.013.02.1.1]RVD24291.1 phosphodiesterase [Mesorhizobium sp. M4B.F.Ca.ET.017.02.2.1]RVD41466.1 phosphodiesterase [Mesorhizobium sp. M4B.F.Ca.ET.019.03.1.1]RWC94331.1 MAG: phosphodiesterase [Mesorhizobium sp.]
MKIIQVTDVHLGRRGEIRFGADLHERLDRCIDHINAHHGDAALCVFTGDLTESGEAQSYADLKSGLARLSVPYRLLPGNHDRRANLVAAFAGNPTDENGFVQSVFDTPEASLLFLDSLAEGRVTGELCDRRLAWLDARLGEAAGRRAYVFLHHPPVELGLELLDPLGLEQPHRLLDVLMRHGNVGYVFFGHVHRDIAGTVAGIPFSAQRGLHARFMLDLVGDEKVEQAPPAYSIILIDGARVVVHSCDFLENWPLWSPATGQRVG